MVIMKCCTEILHRISRVKTTINEQWCHLMCCLWLDVTSRQGLWLVNHLFVIWWRKCSTLTMNQLCYILINQSCYIWCYITIMLYIDKSIMLYMRLYMMLYNDHVLYDSFFVNNVSKKCKFYFWNEPIKCYYTIKMSLLTWSMLRLWDCVWISKYNVHVFKLNFRC